MKNKEILTYSLFGLGFLVLIGLIVWLISAIKKDNSEKTLDESKRMIKPRDLTYSDTTYISWAERLLIAMQGWGTNEATIFQIIESLKTPSDWHKLVTSFGNPDDKSLYAWLQSELSSSDLSRISKHLKTLEITL